MCGLVGMAGRIYGNEKKAFRILHYLDELRGEHSTGLAVVKEKTNDVSIYKAVGGVHDLWDSYPKEFDAKDHDLNSWMMKVYIGHNRFATVGSKTAANAHPFKHGKIVGAHNGTLTYRWLDQLDGSNLFEVDSEAIFYSINKHGLKETINTMHGAWALVYWDGENETVNFIRNKERPLSYCWSKDYKTIFWASEEWMLKVALSKSNIEYTQIHSFNTDYHYELSIPGMGLTLTKDSLVYYDEKLEGFIPPINTSTIKVGFKNWWADQEWWDDQLNGKNENTGVNNSKTDNIVTFPKQQKEVKKEDEDKYIVARSFLHKDVEFIIYGERDGIHVGKYLIADTNGLPDGWEIRLFAEHHPSFSEWRKCDGVYTGRICSIQNKWNKKLNKMDRFLGMDLSSIQKKPETKKETKPATEIIMESQLVWDVNKKYKGFKDEEITFGEFMKAVNAGCIWCGEVITPLEADNVVFVKKGRFACGTCVAGGHALNYYGKNK